MAFWFIKPKDSVCNQNIMLEIEKRGQASECEEVDRTTTKGKTVSVIHIPAFLLTAFKKVREKDRDGLFSFKIYKTTRYSDDLGDGEFVAKKHRAKEVQRVENELRKKKAQQRIQ